MLIEIHVMGQYWQTESAERTELGSLVASAKDERNVEALNVLRRLMASFATSVDLAGGSVIVPVPADPQVDDHPVPDLARAVAEGLGLESRPLVVRRNSTVRVRDTPLADRADVVAGASYEVVGSVRGLDVVLVDDVVMTETTLRHIAALLTDAGAESVTALVAARTRRLG